MAQPNVTKLDDGGYDVEFEGGGRVILNADEASNQKDAVKLAKERIEQSGRTITDESADTPVETEDAATDQGTDRKPAANITNGTDESEDESRNQ